MTRSRRASGDGGFTLIELVVAVGIMGIAMVFIVAGMTTSIFGSDIHRKEATADTVARAFAEQVKNATCSPTCPTTYTYSAPTGYAATATVACGTAGAAGFTAACPNVLEKVKISVASTDGRDAETLEVVKRQP